MRKVESLHKILSNFSILFLIENYFREINSSHLLYQPVENWKQEANLIEPPSDTITQFTESVRKKKWTVSKKYVLSTRLHVINDWLLLPSCATNVLFIANKIFDLFHCVRFGTLLHRGCRWKELKRPLCLRYHW